MERKEKEKEAVISSAGCFLNFSLKKKKKKSTHLGVKLDPGGRGFHGERGVVRVGARIHRDVEVERLVRERGKWRKRRRRGKAGGESV